MHRSELMPLRQRTITAVLQKMAHTMLGTHAPRHSADSGATKTEERLSVVSWRGPRLAPSIPDGNDEPVPPFLVEVEQRLGVIPHFFSMNLDAPDVTKHLWQYAKAAYLDNPVPALFKERLFVHLSRFCEARYCVVRHTGFLIGKGYPAGDRLAVPESIEHAMALLDRPAPNAAALEAVLARLESYPAPTAIPPPRTHAEEDLFDALTVIFVVPGRSAQAREAVRRAVGHTMFEHLAALLAFVRTAHDWTEMHPGFAYETDMILVMAQHQDLARKLLDTSRSEWAHADDALREVLTGQLHVLNTELQHRTRNLLNVIQVVFERTQAKHTTMAQFAEVFSGRLDAIGRVQTYLSRLVQGEKVTFDGLLRSELAAHAIAARQITLDGPNGVRLRSTTLQTFALAIHELAVNAVKHGALACPSAHLTVRWHVEHTEEQPPLLHVYWEETGIEMAEASEHVCKSGYGRELIERALPYQMKARTHYDLTPNGVRCSMSVPVLG